MSVIAVAVAAIVAWEAIVAIFQLPKILLPTPRQCWAAAVAQRSALTSGAIATGSAAVVGLLSAVVFGSLLAILFSQSRRLRMALFPYVILLQTVPVVAIAPLLIIWSGYTFRTVVIVTVIVCFFPIVNSVTSGLLSISPDHADLFRLYNAGRWQRLRRLQIPAAIGNLMVGVKTSAGLAVIGAIVAEFFVGNGTYYDGLGTLITKWQSLSKTDALIAGLFASAAIGLLLFSIAHFVSEFILRRWTRNV